MNMKEKNTQEFKKQTNKKKHAMIGTTKLMNTNTAFVMMVLYVRR